MDNVLLLINIIQMDGIYINLQQCDNYDNLRSELKYIVLKNINYEFEDISSRWKLSTFSYMINVLNNVVVEYLDKRVYPLNEINVFIKQNIYFTDDDLLGYYKNKNLTFLWNK